MILLFQSNKLVSSLNEIISQSGDNILIAVNEGFEKILTLVFKRYFNKRIE